MINEEKLKIQNEALQALRDNNFRGIVILPTGTGKTYVLIEALRELFKPGMSVLYTCDSQLLRDTGFDDELAKWGALEYSQHIEKQCYKGAYKKSGQHYNIGLFDEGDYALTPQYSKLFFNNTFDFIIFVSATLDSSKVKMANEIAPVVYCKKIKDIEQNKVVNKIQFVLVPFLLNEKENYKYQEFNKTFHAYLQQPQTPAIKKRLEFLQIERQNFLAGLESSVYICRKLLNHLYNQHPENKILIFCGINEQADKICKYTYHMKSQHLNNFEKFDKGEIKALAVCGKVNRGINIVGVNNIIIENCKRSQTLMVQRTGRGRRLAVDDTLYAYLLIPYFKPKFGNNRATIVLEWVQHAAKDMGIEKAKTLILN